MVKRFKPKVGEDFELDNETTSERIAFIARIVVLVVGVPLLVGVASNAIYGAIVDFVHSNAAPQARVVNIVPDKAPAATRPP
jgi:hypothetical protein